MGKIRLCFFILLFISAYSAKAQRYFTPGNIVVYRMGDGTGPLTGNMSPVFLDEYTTSGTLVQTIAMPSTGSQKITMFGNAFFQGSMTLSADGRYLVVPGF